jgi:hypothetical protein
LRVVLPEKRISFAEDEVFVADFVLSNARISYDSAWNNYFDPSGPLGETGQSLFNVDLSNLSGSVVTRRLAVNDPSVRDSSMALSLGPKDTPVSVNLCTDGGKLSGVQVEYGVWDLTTLSYFDGTKFGAVHGSLSGVCNKTLLDLATSTVGNVQIFTDDATNEL